jgi:DNA-binding GntR family transcriptional regulator
MGDEPAAAIDEQVPHYTRIRDRLRNEIIEGIFEDDQHLVLAQLCQRYGVSMPPIREALNQLQVEGLVVLEPNRGARVRRITPDFIQELFEIRIVLEPALVGRSVPRFTARDVAALAAIQDGFEDAIVRGDHAALLRGNRLFHEYVYQVHPNQEAIRLLRQHASVIATMRNRFGYHAGRLDRIVAEHRALIRACGDHDAALAMAIARSHIEHSVADLVRQMQAAPVPLGAQVPGLVSGNPIL